MSIFIIICLSIAGLALLIQSYYYGFVYSKFYSYKSHLPNYTPAVSVIICARNEDENLEELLPIFLQQDYPNYELVLVNDCSLDDSERVLEELAKQYPKLHVVTIENNDKYPHGKKFALTLGIKAAKHDILLLSDADCKPINNNWIRHMVAPFENKDTSIVLGYSYYGGTKGFLGACIAWDTFFSALNYLSFAMSGMPYMGVGRNLAYRKELFFQQKGFSSHMHIKSGDDDLFVNAVANNSNTVVCVSNESLVESKPKESWAEWFTQKIRHNSVGQYYKGKHQFVLALQSISVWLFYGSLIALLALHAPWQIVCSIYLFRLISLVIIYYKASSTLNTKKYLFLYPFFDLFYPFLQTLFVLIGSKAKNTTWK